MNHSLDSRQKMDTHRSKNRSKNKSG